MAIANRNAETINHRRNRQACNHISLSLIPRITLVILLGGCASQAPVLYPNDHYHRMGANGAQNDIKECGKLARQAGAQGSGNEAATRAAESAAVGGAAGAGYGAVQGDIGTSAAAGAAAAGAGSLMHSVFHSRNDNNPAYRNYVERCLRERGYDPIGWR